MPCPAAPAKAKTRPRRQVRPLMTDDVRSSLEAMRWHLRPDAALLGLGWAGALHRSELVGLDWLQRGDGDGSVFIEEGQGLVVTLNVPGLKGPNGMPIGMQAIGRIGEDARTLAAANWMELRLT